jgi:hypothetical protein
MKDDIPVVAIAGALLQQLSTDKVRPKEKL